MRTVDLFCGGGGSSCGARAAGAEIVAAVDCWDIAVETFRDNFPGAQVVKARLGEHSGPEIFGGLDDIDLLLASPECTNHSLARGARPKDEESRRSALHVVRFAKELRPRWIVMENVTGMRLWPGFEDLLARLRALGYRTSFETLDAAAFGVPQSRKRLFVICGLDVAPPRIAVPGGRPHTVAEILDPPGTWAAKPVHRPGRAAATLERFGRGLATMGEGRPFLVVYYGSDKAGGWQPLDRTLRTLTTLDRFGLVEWHDGEPTMRMLQVPELRRAMGLPEDFRLERGTRRDKIKVLGNGVCAPVMRAVVEALRRADGLPAQAAA